MTPTAGKPYYVKHPRWGTALYACYCQGVSHDEYGVNNGGIFNIPVTGLWDIHEDEVLAEVFIGAVSPPAALTDPPAPVLPPQPELPPPTTIAIFEATQHPERRAELVAEGRMERLAQLASEIRPKRPDGPLRAWLKRVFFHPETPPSSPQ